MGLTWPSDPHLYRWMLFVDGENLTIRGQKFAEHEALRLDAGDFYEPGIFLWLPRSDPLTYMSATASAHLRRRAIRAHYYTSVAGDDDRLSEIRTRLWERGFQPEVFKKQAKEEKAKGVDIALTKDMLSHAFMDNFDVAVLIAGDGDYVPLVNAVQRLGKLVYVSFFSSEGLNPQLRLASDTFFSMDDVFRSCWSPAESDEGAVDGGSE